MKCPGLHSAPVSRRTWNPAGACANTCRFTRVPVVDGNSGRTCPRAGATTVDDSVAGGMAANPEPEQPVIDFDGQRAMSASDSRRPASVQLLEVQRWMSGVSFEQVEVCIRALSNGPRQFTVRGPERGLAWWFTSALTCLPHGRQWPRRRLCPSARSLRPVRSVRPTSPYRTVHTRT